MEIPCKKKLMSESESLNLVILNWLSRSSSTLFKICLFSFTKLHFNLVLTGTTQPALSNGVAIEKPRFGAVVAIFAIGVSANSERETLKVDHFSVNCYRYRSFWRYLFNLCCIY